MVKSKGPLNPLHIHTIIELINASPYFNLLSIVVKDIGVGYSKIETAVQDKHLNPFGGIHGGVYSSLIDTAAYWSAYCDLPEDEGLITIDVTVNNLAAVKSGKVFIEGKRIKFGRSICLAEAQITDENNIIISHGISKMMIIKGKQTISHILHTSGVCSIPKKFI